MSNTFNAFFIQCITNMHVGSGDANFGIVDKLVQRDTVTDFPTIHSSSLKGALREHFEKEWIHPNFDYDKIKMPFNKILEKVAIEFEKKVNERSFDFLTEYLKDGIEISAVLKVIKKVEAIFGKEANGSDSETGEFKFLGADLVSLPVRCNFQQYVLGVNKTQINYLNKKAELLTNEKLFNIVDEANKLLYIANVPDYELFAEDIKIEDANKAAYAAFLKASCGLKCFDTKYASFNSGSFKSIAKDLPVIARNCIEDGTSQNLWYEEVVPHESVFVTFIATTESLKA
ncbi:MAG: type III-B CRISPR module RAMP protein Cmr4, partial [Bacteroidetes bacterium]|nr:type III-B CRISPR module RAMP protein Cmr4 [Bacteroidota bacterium]